MEAGCCRELWQMEDKLPTSVLTSASKSVSIQPLVHCFFPELNPSAVIRKDGAIYKECNTKNLVKSLNPDFINSHHTPSHNVTHHNLQKLIN